MSYSDFAVPPGPLTAAIAPQHFLANGGIEPERRELPRRRARQLFPRAGHAEDQRALDLLPVTRRENISHNFGFVKRAAAPPYIRLRSCVRYAWREVQREVLALETDRAQRMIRPEPIAVQPVEHRLPDGGVGQSDRLRARARFSTGVVTTFSTPNSFMKLSPHGSPSRLLSVSGHHASLRIAWSD